MLPLRLCPLGAFGSQKPAVDGRNKTPFKAIPIIPLIFVIAVDLLGYLGTQTYIFCWDIELGFPLLGKIPVLWLGIPLLWKHLSSFVNDISNLFNSAANNFIGKNNINKKYFY